MTNSLKGRIWLAAIALALINGVCGLGVYLTLSFLSVDTTVTILSTFFLLAFVTLIFGWWLSTDLLRPIDEVTLLARSLERSPSASLPRTTGAVETDELLQSLHRSGQQLRNLISLMDDVAAGKVEVASAPLESSDKLSASFQKLVSKVTDSISAKTDLDEIRNAVADLAKEVSGVRSGGIELDLRADHPQTREIADTIRYLAGRLSDVTRQIYATTAQCERNAAEARSSLHSTLEAIDERSSVLARNSSTLQCPADRWETLLNELSNAVQNASDTYDQHAAEGASSAQISDSASRLRNGVDEAAKLVQRLRTRTTMISQSARLAQELAKRSNLLALNSAIASSGFAKQGPLAGEIESLSKKSEELHKQILSTGESLNSEIAGIEKELSAVAELAPGLDKVLNSSVQFNHSICERITKIGELEELIRSASDESRLEADRMTGILEKLSDVSLASAMVRETELSVQRFSGLLEGLRDSVADLTLTTSTRVGISESRLPVPSNDKPAFNGLDTVSDLKSSTDLPGDPGFAAKTGFEAVTGLKPEQAWKR